MRKYINEFTEGEKITEIVFAICEISRSTTKKGAPYLRLVLGDKTGKIQARQWDAEGEGIGSGTAVIVNGDIESYQDELQLRVLSMCEVDPAPYISELIESIPEEELNKAEESAYEFIDEIENETLRAVIQKIIISDNFMKKMRIMPASKSGHHSELGGLLTHTVEVTELAKIISKQLNLDKDIMIAGALMHDIGKVFCYEADGIITQMTAIGGLVDHIQMGTHLIFRTSEYIKKKYPTSYDRESILRLAHMIGSHHGVREWGSPITPKTAEAKALHHIDMISSQVEGFRKIAKEYNIDEIWSGWSKKFDGRLYLPAFD